MDIAEHFPAKAMRRTWRERRFGKGRSVGGGRRQLASGTTVHPFRQKGKRLGRKGSPWLFGAMQAMQSKEGIALVMSPTREWVGGIHGFQNGLLRISLTFLLPK